jgi:hypothetical protein
LTRVLSTALVLAVLAATALAFALTERAKLARSPISATSVTKVFSPECAAPCSPGHATAVIRFKLRSRERLTIWIQRGSTQVGTLVSGRVYPPGKRLSFVWNGLTTEGTVLPDGTYKPYVKLQRSHRTIAIPSPILLDTKPPVITVKHPVYPVISPDGDGHADVVRIPYRVSEPAHAILRVGAQQVVLTYRKPLKGTLVWTGKLGHPPRPAKPGRYVLYVSAVDVAGNASKPYPFAIVQVRYVVLARSRVTVAPGHRFAIRVSTDAPLVHWQLHGRSGAAKRGTLHFRAPRTPGTYRLYVYAAGHAARCLVVVE